MKKIISMLLVMTVLFSLVACQPTPAKPVIVKKDSERMLEQAKSEEKGTQLKDLGVPEGRYTYETTGADGKLRIHVDADIITPDVDSMPIAKVSMALFTQEQVTGIFNYLFPNEKPKQDFGQVETKADVEAELLRLKKQLADGNYSGTEDELKAKIKLVEESYSTAPDSAPEGGVSDGTLTRSDLEPDSTYRSLRVSNNDYTLSITTHTNIEGIHRVQLPAVNYFSKDKKRTYTERNMTLTDGSNLTEDMSQSIGFTYDEAKSLCDGFFAAAGFNENEFTVGKSFVLDDTGPDEIKGSNYAYRFLYTRTVNNIPLFFDSMGRLFNKDEAYTLPWSYEIIEFVIDNQGIVSIVWYNPVKIGPIIENAAALKTYDEIISVFEAMMLNSYEGIVLTKFNGEIEFDIDIGRIELCLLRIREQGGAQTDGLLIPAWVFYGRNKGTNSNGEVRYFQGASMLAAFDPVPPNAIPNGNFPSIGPFELAPGASKKDDAILMAINAIDGSIIDLSKGY